MGKSNVRPALFGLANDLESSREARRLAAMMWLEFYLDAEQIPPPIGLTQWECAHAAHVLLYGPTQHPEAQDAWEAARDLTVRIRRECSGGDAE